jgi:hypothetical protein
VEIALWVNVALQKLRCYNGIMNKNSVRDLSDEQLLNDVKDAATRERNATAHLIALLAEMDARQLYLGQGYSSLFVYCTQCLRLSEHAAYGRIEAARAARRFPLVLESLADGSITLTTVCLLASHLTSDNHRHLLDAARHKSKRGVEQQIAALRPAPDVPSMVRKLPQPTLSPTIETPSRERASINLECEPTSEAARPPRVAPPVIRPLAPARYKVQLTIDRETHDKLRRVQDLLRHVVPDGDPAVIFDRALTLLLQDLGRKKHAQVERPRGGAMLNHGSRHVPATVRREVWTRDGGQCAFLGADGRCGERGYLEFHHVVPFAEGGSTTVDNLQLRCRAHNAYEGRQHFGFPLLRERSFGDELAPDRVHHWHNSGAALSDVAVFWRR